MNGSTNDRSRRSAGATTHLSDHPARAHAGLRRALRRTARAGDGRGRDASVPFDLSFARYTASDRHERLAAAASRQRLRRRRGQ